MNIFISTILNIVIGGLIMGGIYALISMGLSMQYGVAKILNVAHGEFIMVGAFLTWMLATNGVNPVIGLLVSAPVTFILGFILHRTMYKRLKDTSKNAGAFEGNAMLVSFGVMYVVQNIALLIWGSTQRGYQFLSFPIRIAGVSFPANRLFVLGFAIVIGIVFNLFLMKSRMGKSIRAAAQDPVAASLMGIKIHTVMAICFGIGAMLAGVAGTLLSMIIQFNTTIGMGYTIIAIIVVVLGGLGSIPGSIVGGFILGVVGSAVSYIDPSLSLIAFYAIIMLLLLVRPKGLFGR